MESLNNKNKISQYLSIIQKNIENNNSIGYYDINRKMEDIVAEILSIIYGTKFINMNIIHPNFPAIDLANDEERIAVQVSSNNSYEKINETFKKFVNSKKNLKDKYDLLLFFFTKGKLEEYKTKKIENYGINYEIIDYNYIIEKIANFTNGKLSLIAEILENEYISKPSIDISLVNRVKYEELKENYVPRTIRKIKDTNSLLKLNIKDIIKNDKKIVLLTDAGEGKTEEIKRLANYANSNSFTSTSINTHEQYRLYAFYEELNTYTGEEISQLIPNEYEFLPCQNILFVFDGYDEIENKYREDFRKKLKKYCEKNKDITVVVTCRRNFYELEDDNFSGTLEGFVEYTLCRITEEDIDEILNAEKIDKKAFWEEAENKELNSIVFNPFYLNSIIKQYKENRILPTKEKLLDKMIDDMFTKDRNRYMNYEYKNLEVDFKRLKNQSEKMLQTVGLTLQYLGKNYLNNDEYEELIPNLDDRILIEHYGIWGKTNDDTWKFIHNNFAEYLAAKKMKNYSIDKIKSAVCFQKIPNIINPKWVNTLSFLVNLYKDSSLIKWLVQVMPEFLFKIDKNIIDDNMRKELFWKVYMQCKEEKRIIPHIFFENGNYAYTEKDIEYVINEINENKNCNTENALYILNSANTFYNKKEEVKNTLINVCINPNYAKVNKKNALYILANFKLANLNDLRNIIEKNKLIENNDLQEGYFYFCNKLDIIDASIDIFLDRFYNYDRSRHEDTNWQKEFTKAFELIRKKETLDIVLDFVLKANIKVQYIIYYNFELLDEFIISIFNTYSDKEEIAEKLVEILIKIYGRTSEAEINFIEKISRERGIDLIEHCNNQYKKKIYSDEIIKTILSMQCFWLNSNYFELASIYKKRTKKEIKDNISKAIIYSDKKEIRRKRAKKFIDTLFNKESFLNNVKEYIKQIPNNEIKIKNLNSEFPMNFFLKSFFQDKESITLETFEEIDWDYFILSGVNNILTTQKIFIELTKKQQNTIIKICNKKIFEVDFKNAIQYNNEGQISHMDWLCYLLWYFRAKFDLKYPSSILLDMLAIDYKILEDAIFTSDINAMIEEQKSRIKYIIENAEESIVKNRIINNIKKANIHQDVFTNHVAYCIKNNINDLTEPIGKHLLDNKLSNGAEIYFATIYLIAFMPIEDFLEKYFYKVDIEKQKEIISIIIELDEKNAFDLLKMNKTYRVKALNPWLKEIIKKDISEEDKLYFSRILLENGQKEGIEYLCNWIEEKIKYNKVEEISSLNIFKYSTLESEIRNINSIDMLEALLKLFEIIYINDSKEKILKTIFECLEIAIINIGSINSTNFAIVKEKLKKLFDKFEDYNGEMHHIVAEMELKYGISSQRVLTIEEVKKMIME